MLCYGVPLKENCFVSFGISYSTTALPKLLEKCASL